MNTILNKIDAALREEDVEGFIGTGAPPDEYSHEAKEIASALAILNGSQPTEQAIVSIIANIWMKYFNLSNQDIKKRLSAFHRIAQRII